MSPQRAIAKAATREWLTHDLGSLREVAAGDRGAVAHFVADLDDAGPRFGQDGVVVVERERHLGELNAIHRPVLLALSLLFLTGVLMIASDVTTFLASPILWLKLGLVALLVINGVVLERTETSLRRADSPNDLWGRLRLAAICSIALWIATLVVGTTLVSA